VRVPYFFETAAHVVDMDRKRRRAFAYIQVTSAGERGEAERRMNENAAIIGQVRGSLEQRVASYRFALERLIIMSPSSQAAQVELMINQLKTTIARYRQGAPLVRAESSLARNNSARCLSCHARPCAGHPHFALRRKRRGWPGQSRP
jgi:hypothetical protein